MTIGSVGCELLEFVVTVPRQPIGYLPSTEPQSWNLDGPADDHSSWV